VEERDLLTYEAPKSDAGELGLKSHRRPQVTCTIACAMECTDASHNAIRLGDLKIAVVHEWIGARAGSEQVFESIADSIPHADLYALSWDPKIPLNTRGRKITTTCLDTRLLRNRRGLTLPMMPFAWSALGADDYDVVISSHHAFAHSNRLTSKGIHLGYVYTPARYVWTPEIDPRGSSRWLTPARRVLQRADLAASKKVTDYAAISSAVQQRIEQAWGRRSRVIHPPVQVEYFAEGRPASPQGDYVLGIGRWIKYKRLDLVIQAADLAGVPVKIAGRGPERACIEAAAAVAKVPVQLIESPSDEELRELYQNARCLLFPTFEDFGMVPVEAMAAGTPVVAVALGGALDTVEHGTTGLLAQSADPAELAELIGRVGELDRDACAKAAQRFSAGRFQAEIHDWIAQALAQHES
jgi:glycosyltransferase involved in cell wall biosynthesis